MSPFKRQKKNEMTLTKWQTGKLHVHSDEVLFRHQRKKVNSQIKMQNHVYVTIGMNNIFAANLAVSFLNSEH